MKRQLNFYRLLILMLLMPQFLGAQNRSFNRYLTPDEVSTEIKNLEQENHSRIKIHKLSVSFSGTNNLLVEVGSEISATIRKKPAVMVVANIEGINPHASLAALYLITDLLAHPAKTDSLTWYILPVANPDAASRYFIKPLYADSRNNRPFNDDMDEAIDEDPFEDLNGDGFITMMRVKDPDGTMVPDSIDARLLRRADASKGEKGVYKIYTEGVDNDRDGTYNEDGPGGTNLAVQFPHLFPYDKPASGIFAGYEPEIHALFGFVTQHPEIAMTMTYGSTNFCLTTPRTNRKGSVDLSSIKLPSRYARMLNADPEKNYSMEEVKEMMKAIVPPGTTVDDNMVASMLDQGPVVNPLGDDLKLYKALNEEYKKYLKDLGFTAKRVDPAPDQDGSFELWSYYQLGLPTFSMDFWGVPEIKAEGKGQRARPGLDPGAEGKAEGKEPAPGSTRGQKAEGKEEEERKKDSPDKLFLIYSDSLLGGKGFVEWKKYQHPVLGEVEIGGEVPFARTVPPVEQMDSLLKIQIPWIYELVNHIPDLKITDQKVDDLGAGIYRVTIWIRNNSKFSYPIAMGKRNKVPVPAQLKLAGKSIDVISGRDYQAITGIDAFGKTKVEWIIKSPDATDLKIELNVVNAYGDEINVKLGGN